MAPLPTAKSQEQAVATTPLSVPNETESRGFVVKVKLGQVLNQGLGQEVAVLHGERLRRFCNAYVQTCGDESMPSMGVGDAQLTASQLFWSTSSQRMRKSPYLARAVVAKKDDLNLNL